MTKITLTRFDEKDSEPVSCPVDPSFLSDENKNRRESAIEKFNLPENAVIKVFHDGKLIPWSMALNVPTVDIHVFRPRQNFTPKASDANPATDSLVKEKLRELESRIASLEAIDSSDINVKTERDLQVLSKQISFLAKRMDEAEQAEWIEKPSN